MGLVVRLLSIMAERKSSLQQMEEELTCAVCAEQFEEPKLLPCHHYYCKKCVAALLASSKHGHVISCPECRHQTEIANPDR